MATAAHLSVRSFGRQQTHAHAGFHQLVLPLAGSLELEVARQAECLHDARAAVVLAGVPHSFRSAGENRFIVLDVPSMPEAATRAASRQPFFSIDPALRALVRYLDAELAGGVLDRATAHHAGHLLLHRLMLGWPTGGGHSRAVARALDYLHRHFAEPVPVERLAGACGVSVSHLHELFKRETGASPADFLAELRLDHAMALLRTSQHPIAEIAAMVGYSDQSALTRSMRARRRITPGQVRQRRP